MSNKSWELRAITAARGKFTPRLVRGTSLRRKFTRLSFRPGSAPFAKENGLPRRRVSACGNSLLSNDAQICGAHPAYVALPFAHLRYRFRFRPARHKIVSLRGRQPVAIRTPFPVSLQKSTHPNDAHFPILVNELAFRRVRHPPAGASPLSNLFLIFPPLLF